MPPAQMFLTSHEGWVVSYLMKSGINNMLKIRFRPLSRYGGFLRFSNSRNNRNTRSFRPLSRYGWFPTLLNFYANLKPGV